MWNYTIRASKIEEISLKKKDGRNCIELNFSNGHRSELCGVREADKTMDIDSGIGMAAFEKEKEG